MHHLSSCDDQEKNICDNEWFGRTALVWNNALKKHLRKVVSTKIINLDQDSF